jgi:hypothetical protein
VEWPTWWDWELEFTPHLERRMEDRDFTEVDLRRMLETARGYREHGEIEGRFVVDARHHGGVWEVIIEPDHEEALLVVVTAYPLEETA